MARRFYANFAPTQNLSSGITSTSPTLNCSSFSGWPTSYPFTATIDYGLPSAEIVLVTNISGTLANVTRGYDNSVAVAHAAGATFDLTPTAKDLDEANSHINNTAGVHGVSGNVVGTSDVQTLTNKTFAGSTGFASISGTSATFTATVAAASLSVGSGTVSGGAGTFTGALSAASATISGNQTVQGNQTVNGAMIVTGNQTNAGNITASGAVSGIFVPKQYANEAAASAATTATGAVVYLTAPTTNGNAAGLFEYNGSSWVPLLDGAAWQSYAPVWNQTLGNGTISGFYKPGVGKTINYELSLTLGSTSAVTTSTFTWTVPVPANLRFGTRTPGGTALFYGGAEVVGFVTFVDSTHIQVVFHGQTAPATKDNPGTWGAGTQIVFQGTYESA